MNRTQKEELISEFTRKFSEANMAILTDFTGLTVEDLTGLRQQLRKSKCELKVVKNTLAKRAISNLPFSETQNQFQGPVAVAFGFGDPVASTKVLFKFSEEQNKLKIKVGIIEGQIIDPRGIKEIASLPSREGLYAQLVSRLQSPIYGMVGSLNQILTKLVYALSAVKDKKEGQSS